MMLTSENVLLELEKQLVPGWIRCFIEWSYCIILYHAVSYCIILYHTVSKDHLDVEGDGQDFGFVYWAQWCLVKYVLFPAIISCQMSNVTARKTLLKYDPPYGLLCYSGSLRCFLLLLLVAQRFCSFFVIARWRRLTSSADSVWLCYRVCGSGREQCYNATSTELVGVEGNN